MKFFFLHNISPINNVMMATALGTPMLISSQLDHTPQKSKEHLGLAMGRP